MKHFLSLAILVISLLGQGSLVGFFGKNLQTVGASSFLKGQSTEDSYWRLKNKKLRQQEGPRSFMVPIGDYYRHIQNSDLARVNVRKGHLPRGTSYVWVQLSGFYQDTCRRVHRSLRRGRMTVLDLRGNRGGLVRAARCVMGLFVPKNTELWSYRDYNTGKKVQSFFTQEKMVSADPLLILVDGKTASVAEVLAASLGEQGRANVVGQRTRGKGTVQVGQRGANGEVHYQTRYLFVLPSGKSIQFEGWQPDFLVDGFQRRGEGELGVYKGYKKLVRQLSQWNNKRSNMGSYGKKSNSSQSSLCRIDNYGRTAASLLVEVFRCQQEEG